jgi:broad specificity phosphatase PhoE
MTHRSAVLVFVRHARVDCSRNGHALLCGRHDIPLSSTGRKQVEKLRERLACEPEFDALYSSHLRRAVETASAAPVSLQPSLRKLRSLAEINCGALDGLPLEIVQREYSEYWEKNEAQTDEDFCWLGGETYRRFRQRVLRAVWRIARLHSGQRVLIVTHAGVVNQVLGTITGQSAARWHNLRPRNASVTRVLWDGEGGRVECFDDCTHL